MTMRIKNLYRNQGKMESFGLDFELTAIEEEELCDMPDDPVQVELADLIEITKP